MALALHYDCALEKVEVKAGTILLCRCRQLRLRRVQDYDVFWFKNSKTPLQPRACKFRPI